MTPIRRSSRIKALAFTVATAVLLSACVSFGSKAVPSLLVLTSNQSLGNGAQRAGTAKEAFVVQAPLVPQKLNTNRLPIYFGNSQLAYLKDAVWAEKPATLFQNLMIETLTARSGRLVLSDAEAGSKAEQILSGTLVEFGIDSGKMQAIAIFDAMRLSKGQIIEKRRFEVRRPVTIINGQNAGGAMNEVANELASAISDWFAS